MFFLIIMQLLKTSIDKKNMAKLFTYMKILHLINFIINDKYY